MHDLYPRNIIMRLVDRLRAGREKAPPGDITAPLLTEREIADLARRVQALRLASRHGLQVHHRHIGDFRSAYLGRGLDFEEVRPYQPGDDTRDMDWRTTARTGKAYLKIYREEHHPALHVVVDRGASMRFGTRARLKATQAARIAAVFAFAAENTCVGGTVLQPEPLVLPCRHGEEGAAALVRAAAAPCPPIVHPGEADRAGYGVRLRHLDALLPPGSKLVLVSDFSLLQDTDRPLLARLAARHRTYAVQVLDAVETALPELGMVRFLDLATGKARQLDAGSRQVREAYAREALGLIERRSAWLRDAGAAYYRCTTGDDPVELFAQIAAHE